MPDIRPPGSWTPRRPRVARARRWLSLVASVVCGVAAARATLAEALVATQVLRAAGVGDAYVTEVRPPAGVVAMEKSYRAVFDLGGTVWSYAPESGTALLGASPRAGPGYRDALVDRLLPLLPSGTTVRLYPQAVMLPEAELSQRSLANACVVSSVLSLALHVRQAGPPAEAGLVLFRLEAPARLERVDIMPVDHAVLVLRLAENWYCVEPGAPAQPKRLERLTIGEGVDPVLLATARQLGRSVQRAVYFPFSPETLTQLARRADPRASR
jgi:hypothetical protein